MPLPTQLLTMSLGAREQKSARPRWQVTTLPSTKNEGNVGNHNMGLTYEPHFNPVKNIKPLDKALSKTLKFRAVTLVTTLSIAWILTGNPVTSIGLTAIQQSTNTAVYYFFEKNEKKLQKESLGN